MVQLIAYATVHLCNLTPDTAHLTDKVKALLEKHFHEEEISATYHNDGMPDGSTVDTPYTTVYVGDDEIYDDFVDMVLEELHQLIPPMNLECATVGAFPFEDMIFAVSDPDNHQDVWESSR